MESFPVILVTVMGKFHSVYCEFDTALKKSEFQKVPTLRRSVSTNHFAFKKSPPCGGSFFAQGVGC